MAMVNVTNIILDSTNGIFTEEDYEYIDLSTGHFYASASRLRTNDKYKRYFQEIVAAGHALIMTKGDDELSDSDYIKAAKEMGARRLVIPHSKEDNIKRLEEFLTEWNRIPRNAKCTLIVTPVGKTVGEWRKQCGEMIQKDSIIRGIALDVRLIENADEPNKIREKMIHSLSQPNHYTKKYELLLLGTFGEYERYLTPAYRDVNYIVTDEPLKHKDRAERYRDIAVLIRCNHHAV